jgi:hypothetical protein
MQGIGHRRHPEPLSNRHVALGVLLTVMTDNPIWDACGTIAVAMLLLLMVAVFIIHKVKGMITGELAAP